MDPQPPKQNEKSKNNMRYEKNWYVIPETSTTAISLAVGNLAARTLQAGAQLWTTVPVPVLSPYTWYLKPANKEVISG
jgi:hypothetical protein